MPFRVRHPALGYYAGCTYRSHATWSKKPYEAKVFYQRRAAEHICCRQLGTMVEPFKPDPTPDWRSIAVPFESEETALIGVPCGGFGQLERAGAVGRTGAIVVGGDCG